MSLKTQADLVVVVVGSKRPVSVFKYTGVKLSFQINLEMSCSGN